MMTQLPKAVAYTGERGRALVRQETKNLGHDRVCSLPASRQRFVNQSRARPICILCRQRRSHNPASISRSQGALCSGDHIQAALTIRWSA